MKTKFLSGGRGVTASDLNEAISVGRRSGIWEPVTFSVSGNDLLLSAHKCSFQNGVVVVSEGEEYKVDSYITLQGNSYRGTLVYNLDPDLNFEVEFEVISGIELPGTNPNRCVLGWIIADGNTLETSNFFSAPVSSESVWLFSELEVGELPNLVREVEGVHETYTNETATTQTIVIERYIPIAEKKVNTLRFHGSLETGVILDCYVSSERRDWMLVNSIQGPQESSKFKLGVFAFEQGEYEMTSIRFVFKVPTSKSFTLDLIGATNELNYGISKN